jgi:hypothetical protein
MTNSIIVKSISTAVLVLIMLGLGSAQSRPSDHLDDVLKRGRWFSEQRAYPFGAVPGDARIRAIQQLRKMSLTEATMGIASLPTWTPIGPRPTSSFWETLASGGSSGRVTALAVTPGNPSLVYLGAADGGVWKTVDGGLNWTPLTDKQPSLSIGSIAIDPNNSNSVYVGTGEENFSGDEYGGAGILKSTDAGAHWTQLPGPFVFTSNGGTHIGSLAVSPADGQVLLAAVESFGGTLPWGGGVLRSSDGGVTWTSTLGGIASSVLSPLTPKEMVSFFSTLRITLSSVSSSTIPSCGPKAPRKATRVPIIAAFFPLHVSV